MQSVTLVGIDLSKHSFHLHGQDRASQAVFHKKVSHKKVSHKKVSHKKVSHKKVSRKQLVEFLATFHACTVVMEACAGAHYMGLQTR